MCVYFVCVCRAYVCVIVFMFGHRKVCVFVYVRVYGCVCVCVCSICQCVCAIVFCSNGLYDLGFFNIDYSSKLLIIGYFILILGKFQAKRSQNIILKEQSIPYTNCLKNPKKFKIEADLYLF